MNHSTVTYTNAKIYTAQKTIESGFIQVDENGVIVAVGEVDALSNQDLGETVDLKGQQILPGFIDVHIHGGNGYSSMDESIESIDQISQYHAKHGTTSFLATTSTASADKIKRGLKVLAEATEKGVSGAELLGVHLEGPFINIKRSGAQDKATIQEPDLLLLKEFLAASKDTIKLVTIATELDADFELTKYLLDQKITVSIGHSDASYQEVLEAVKLGVTHTTHHFNGMRPMHHRDPGLAGAGLLIKEIKAELIADGFHVHPDVIKHLFDTKGCEGVCMITDAVACAGLPDGEYGKVRMFNGEVYLKDGSSLAGSTLTMINALKNVIKFTGYTIEEILPSLTLVPAREIGLEQKKGSLEAGKDADFLVVDDELNIQSTYVKGNQVYERARVL